MDPFQRFAKGYTEAVWRYFFQKDKRNIDGSVMKVISTT
jgi:hypothetical protein